MHAPRWASVTRRLLCRVTFGNVPFLSARVHDHVAWITWLYVPPEMRRQGIGRRMVDDWEAHMPADVREVRLLAADVDGEDPIPFWEKLGFHDEAVPPWVGEVRVRLMSRGVAGRPVH